MVAIAVDRLSVALGGRTVLADVDAAFAAGEFVGIIGPNGAGKSTLVRAMLGLVRPERGVVTIDGRALPAIPRAELARTLAYLPQGQTLHWPLDVARLVALGRLPHLGPLSRVAEADGIAVNRAMARADVTHLAGRVATELSGGERARVMLARALAVEAPALIADEPLASLDPGHQLDVMALLAREAREGALVIAVLHELTMAARFCDRLVLMDRGRIVAAGKPAEVLDPERLRSVYGIAALIGSHDGAPLVVPTERLTGA